MQYMTGLFSAPEFLVNDTFAILCLYKQLLQITSDVDHQKNHFKGSLSVWCLVNYNICYSHCTFIIQGHQKREKNIYITACLQTRIQKINISLNDRHILHQRTAWGNTTVKHTHLLHDTAFTNGCSVFTRCCACTSKYTLESELIGLWSVVC